MAQRRTAGVGLALALLSAATFSTSGSLARSLTEAGWSPEAAVTVRISVGALLLAVPAILSMRGRWPALWRNAGSVTVYGLVAVAGGQVFFFNAVQHLSVGVALLIEYLGTVLVVGWLWLRHGQVPRRLTVAGSVTALVGLVLVLNIVGGARLDPIGVLWGLAAAVGLAAYFLLSSRETDGVPPVMVAGAGMGVGAAALLGLGAAGLVPMHARLGAVELAGQRTTWLVPVIGLSLVAAAFAYVAGIGAARMLGARLASFVGLTEVVFAVLVAWLVLGELPTAVQLLGGALIVAGVALVRVDELRAPDAATGQPTVAPPTPTPAGVR
ncbi:MAG TPA: DMT family transporter [Micromonosporaceae bacterium]|jgi:drug/metabolite transporter (DMT)-like permease